MSSRKAAAAAFGALAALTVVGQAAAFECFVEKKPSGAGAVGVVDLTVAGEPFTPSKSNPGTFERPHGGFVTLDFGGGQTADILIHIPQGGPNAGSHELPPVASGVQADCDGKGLGELSACFPE